MSAAVIKDIFESDCVLGVIPFYSFSKIDYDSVVSHQTELTFELTANKRVGLFFDKMDELRHLIKRGK